MHDVVSKRLKVDGFLFLPGHCAGFEFAENGLERLFFCFGCRGGLFKCRATRDALQHSFPYAGQFRARRGSGLFGNKMRIGCVRELLAEGLRLLREFFKPFVLGRNGGQHRERELFRAWLERMRERADLFAQLRVDELLGSGEEFRSSDDRGRSHGGGFFDFLFRGAPAAQPEFNAEDGNAVGDELSKKPLGEVSES